MHTHNRNDLFTLLQRTRRKKAKGCTSKSDQVMKIGTLEIIDENEEQNSEVS